MKTRYKHIHFVDCHAERVDKKLHFRCENNKTDYCLGTVEYYSLWKRYVFAPEPNAVFDESCLKDIIHFMGQL